MKILCRICDHESQHIFNELILYKYDVMYYYCNNCGFLQTESPYWIKNAYNAKSNFLDTGIMQRNISTSNTLACILYFLFSTNGKYLDVGGGYGIFTRLMRDIGFDFYLDDKYCENIFAVGFQLSNTVSSFDAITCFEVLEHVLYPVRFLSEALSGAMTRTVIFSTELFADPPPGQKDWWYYSFGSGQHISFFQMKTLKYIASQLGLNLYSSNMIHIITDKVLPFNIFKILTSRLSEIICQYIRWNMKSRTLADHKMLSKSASSGREILK
jgi:hypothetical protein